MARSLRSLAAIGGKSYRHLLVRCLTHARCGVVNRAHDSFKVTVKASFYKCLCILVSHITAVWIVSQCVRIQWQMPRRSPKCGLFSHTCMDYMMFICSPLSPSVLFLCMARLPCAAG